MGYRAKLLLLLWIPPASLQTGEHAGDRYNAQRREKHDQNFNLDPIEY